MNRFEKGDHVRIDIPDKSDPDHDHYHGREGTVVDVDVDDAGLETGDERDSVDYRIKFEDGESMHFRWRDLRPAFEKDDC